MSVSFSPKYRPIDVGSLRSLWTGGREGRTRFCGLSCFGCVGYCFLTWPSLNWYFNRLEERRVEMVMVDSF